MTLVCAPVRASDSLAEGFKHPPQAAKPQVWWHWMYGNITKEGITKDLEQMQKLGIGGVTQFHNAWAKPGSARSTPKGPIRFMSPEYQDLVQYAVQECDRLGLTMGLQICDGFSQTGGPWVKPETGMRKLQVNIIPVSGGKKLTAKLPDKAVRILAYPGTVKAPEPAADAKGKKKQKKNASNPMVSPEEPYLNQENSLTPAIGSFNFIDLTAKVTGQALSWNPPAGDWVVLVFYDALHPATNHPASPEGHGLEANKLNYRPRSNIVYEHI